MLPDNQAKKGVEEFLFFASLKSYDYFSEENECFLISQSLTACQKQTRQVIKISRHRFCFVSSETKRYCFQFRGELFR